MAAFSRFLRLFNPMVAIRDFRTVWIQDNPHRLRVLALSAAATFAIFFSIVDLGKSQRIEPRPPEVTYINVLDPTRTDEQIRAENIANQREKEKRFAEAEAREERVRQIYEAVGKASGIDTSEARRQGEAERAAYEAKLAEARKRAMARVRENAANEAETSQQAVRDETE